MDNTIKQMKFAGQFYEKDPAKLQNFIDNAKDTQIVKLPKNHLTKAVILPHAGHVFSGKTAIKTLISAQACNYKNIFIIAPSHYVGFKGLALSSYSEYATPLGNIKVNKEIVNILSKNGLAINNEAHLQEHSLEVLLPIIKDMFQDIPIIPMICGFSDKTNSSNIAKTLQSYWNDDKNLWIISSDFTHYGRNFSYTPFIKNIKENLSKLDHSAIEKILELNPDAFYDYVTHTGITICGKFPILIMLYLANNYHLYDNLKTDLTEYLTSGDITGDYSHCVSYAGITIYKQ